MELKLLMSRIVAAVNRGDAPDGAALATEYNAAVGAVTARLEAVQTAVHAGQTSEALRIMEDEPRLLMPFRLLSSYVWPNGRRCA